jgi:dienelactone hydrolase
LKTEWRLGSVWFGKWSGLLNAKEIMTLYPAKDMEIPTKQMTLFSPEAPEMNLVMLTMYDSGPNCVIRVRHMKTGEAGHGLMVETEAYDHQFEAAESESRWREIIDSLAKSGYLVPPERE